MIDRIKWKHFNGMKHLDLDSGLGTLHTTHITYYYYHQEETHMKYCKMETI